MERKYKSSYVGGFPPITPDKNGKFTKNVSGKLSEEKKEEEEGDDEDDDYRDDFYEEEDLLTNV